MSPRTAIRRPLGARGAVSASVAIAAQTAAGPSGEEPGGEDAVVQHTLHGDGKGKKPRQRPTKYRKLTRDQRQHLEMVFASCPQPDKELKERLAKQLGTTYNHMRTWFSNRRTKARRAGEPMRGQDESGKDDISKRMAAVDAVVAAAKGGPQPPTAQPSRAERAAQRAAVGGAADPGAGPADSPEASAEPKPEAEASAKPKAEAKPRRPAQVVNEQTRVIGLLKGLQGQTQDTGVQNIFQKVIETAETYLRPW